MRFKINLLHFLLITVFLGTSIGLYISNMPRELVVLTADNFKKQVVDNDRPVLVAFTADWCPPCQTMKPELQEFAASTRRATIGTVNIDTSPGIAAQFGISVVPTLIVFRDGKPSHQTSGSKDKSELRQILFGQ